MSDKIQATTQRIRYVEYVTACKAEGLVPHSFHMWTIHDEPEGPLG